MNTHALRQGLSFVELLAVLAIIGVLVTVIMPRVTGESAAAKSAACHAYQGDIEIQCELWKHNTGVWPAANLSNIGANLSYFPQGLPLCPVDGTTYNISTVTGRVIGHNH